MFFLLLIFVLVRSFRHPARCAGIRDGYSAVVAYFWCCESGVVTTPPRVSPVLPFDHKIKATFQFLTVSVAFTFTVLLQSILQADSNSPQLEFDRLKNEKIVTFPARKHRFPVSQKITPKIPISNRKNAKSRKKLAENSEKSKKWILWIGKNAKLQQKIMKSFILACFDILYRF